MIAKKPFRKKDLLIITTIVIILLAGFALEYSHTIHDGTVDPVLIPVNTQNESCEANATFVLGSGNQTFRCEVADTYEERRTGLMDRESLENDAGMLFVFDAPRSVSFWMKDTLIPLDIIFINQTGHVVNIEEADPEPGVSDAFLTHYPSDGPVLWVLEINQGICATEGIVPGTYVDLQYAPGSD